MKRVFSDGKTMQRLAVFGYQACNLIDSINQLLLGAAKKTLKEENQHGRYGKKWNQTWLNNYSFGSVDQSGVRC